MCIHLFEQILKMLTTLQLSFYRRIVYLNCQQTQQLSTKPDKQPRITFGFSEFSRDTQLLSSVKLKSVTGAKTETKAFKKLLIDFEPDLVVPENETKTEAETQKKRIKEDPSKKSN